MSEWGRDWFTLSIARSVMEPLTALAEFWRVSPENAISLLIRAVEQQEWPRGDVAHDPSAYQEWALSIVGADPLLNPSLPTERDRATLAELGIDAAGLPEGLPLRERKNPFERHG